MKSIRDDFVRGTQAVIRRLAGSPRGGEPVVGKASDRSAFWKSLYDWTTKPENRTTLLSLIWLILVFSGLLLTALFVLFLFPITSGNTTGLYIAAVVWGGIFALGVLFIFPPKPVIAVFGGLLGISVSEGSTAAGLITEADKAITALLKTINPEIMGLKAAVWIFVIVVSVACSPALVRDN